MTLAVAVWFISASPFPALVDVILMGPLLGVTGWIWIGVILRRDVEQLRRLTGYAARRRNRRRGRGSR